MQKIMFNDAYGLTQATIEGRKTMTRREEFSDEVQQLLTEADEVYMDADDVVAVFDSSCENVRLSTRYKVGEVVAVAQRYQDIFDKSNCVNPFAYLDDEKQSGWTNKMFVKAELMPHRIRITGIRVEQLQDISDDDCIKEGIIRIPPEMVQVRPFYFCNNQCHYDTPREAFAALIDKVSGRGTWARNPWVVAYEYELVK